MCGKLFGQKSRATIEHGEVINLFTWKYYKFPMVNTVRHARTLSVKLWKNVLVKSLLHCCLILLKPKFPQELKLPKNS